MAHSPILSRPFYDLGLESTLQRTSQLHDLSRAYKDNVHAILQAERERVASFAPRPVGSEGNACGNGGSSGSGDAGNEGNSGGPGKPPFVRLMDAMQAQKKPLYSPSFHTHSRSHSHSDNAGMGTGMGTGKSRTRSLPSSPVSNSFSPHAFAPTPTPADDPAPVPVSNAVPASAADEPLPLKTRQSPPLAPLSPPLRPSSPAGYSPQPWAASTLALPPSLQPSATHATSTSASSRHTRADAAPTAAAGYSPNPAAHAGATGAIAPPAPVVLPLSRVLSAPEVRQSLANLSDSLYVDELRALSPQIGRMLGAGARGVGGYVEIGESVRLLAGPVGGGAGRAGEGERGEGEAAGGAEADGPAARVLEAAVLEARGRAERDADVARAMRAGREYVAGRLATEEAREQALHARVRAQLHRSHASALKIAAIRAARVGETEARKADKEARREAALDKMESHTSSLQHERARVHLARQQRITNERQQRQERVEREVFGALGAAEEAIARHQQQQERELAERARLRDEAIEAKGRAARGMETDITARRAETLALKSARHAEVGRELESSRRQQALERRAREADSGFRAEQRRRLIDLKREGGQATGQIRQAQERVVASAHAKIGRDRRAALNRIFAQALAERPHTPALDASPGPGEYDVAARGKCRGGYMASSRVAAAGNANPGPGHYSLPQQAPSRGAVPFLPRGKTDVDWTILAASRLPGVGTYELCRPSTAPARAVTLTKKGTSQLDLAIARGRCSPGVGDYDVCEAVPARGGIERQLLGLD